MTPDQQKRFWNKVLVGHPDECWEWQGSKNSGGYGNLHLDGTTVQAHRVAYWLTYGGDKPMTKFRNVGWAKKYRRFVLHRCDNRPCCNPSHLFLGSMSSNQKDAYKKGRKVQPRSEHANAKLTADQVRWARRAYSEGARQIDLAEKLGVCQRVISKVVRNETYKDVV